MFSPEPDPHDPLPYCDCGACAIVERDRLRAGLRDLIDALADVSPYGLDLSDTNAPGHGHETAGVWDDDNAPAIAGKPCETCAAWNRARALLRWNPPIEETTCDSN